MKIDLTSLEKKQLDQAVQSNPVRKWFTARDTMKFEVGDVLVKHIKVYDATTNDYIWKVENINSDTKMAQRYVYIFEDEVGIGYFKQLKVSTGTLGKELFCATHFDFDSTRFEVDPEYAEHMLLDAEFNIKTVHKKSLEARRIITKMNRKAGKKLDTVKEFNDFFLKLNAGDVFYTTSDYTGRRLNSYNIQKIEQIPITKIDDNYNWWWRSFKEKNPKGVDDTFVFKIAYTDNYGKQERFIMEYHGAIFYMQEPAKEDKK